MRRFVQCIPKVKQRLSGIKIVPILQNDNKDIIDSGKLLCYGWSELHASESEAIVKAEKYGKFQSIKDLQIASVKHLIG